eukprot:TRINITY_DN13471_c0_g1_i1.p1 TRINITY_DN13471_c0_g1~~TRINITY_DN13471_c0_g1_i1.p1  ORF type:complete len:233 (+),score=33.06 TRINITY_DN13471_c0_g1_i1:138-836(+)
MRRLGDVKIVRGSLSRHVVDAAAAGNLQVIESFLEQTAVKCLDHNSFQETINSPDTEGRYPLLVALTNRRVDVASVLLRAGVRVSTGPTEDSAILAASGDTNLLQMLLKRHCNANSPRVLLLIASHGLLDECHSVVKRGASVRVRDSNGITAANLALRNGHIKVYEFLSRHERILETTNFLLISRRRTGETDPLRLPLPLLKMICAFMIEHPDMSPPAITATDPIDTKATPS